MANTDSETGESIVPQREPEIEIREFDLETGESDGGMATLEVRKTRFVIPRRLIQQAEPECRGCIPPDESFSLADKAKVINFQEQIILGYNKTSHRLFLIPTLLIFIQIWAPLICLIETLLHMWAHRKNSKNTNPSIYYRSPLHIITSQFCAYCRHKVEMEQVSRIQDKRLKDWRIHLCDLSKSVS